MKKLLLVLLGLVPSLMFSQTAEEFNLVPFTRSYDSVYIRDEGGETGSANGKTIFVFNYGEKTQMLQIMPDGERYIFHYLTNPVKKNFDLFGMSSIVKVIDNTGGEWVVYLADDINNGVILMQGDFTIHFFNNVGQFD